MSEEDGICKRAMMMENMYRKALMKENIYKKGQNEGIRYAKEPKRRENICMKALKTGNTRKKAFMEWEYA